MQHRCGESLRIRNYFPVKIGKDTIGRSFNFYCEKFLFFSAVDGKNAVSCQFGESFIEIIIHFIDRFGVRVFGSR